MVGWLVSGWGRGGGWCEVLEFGWYEARIEGVVKCAYMYCTVFIII